MLYPKTFIHMISFRGDFKILDFNSKEAGQLAVEIVPCTKEGQVIDPDKGAPVVRNPEVELLDKTFNFIVKINKAANLSDKYDVYFRNCGLDERVFLFLF